MEQKAKQKSHVAQNIVGVIFGLIEAILAFRLIFKLLGANPGNVFVNGTSILSHSLLWEYSKAFSPDSPPKVQRVLSRQP
jgi:hypothetical protein